MVKRKEKSRNLLQIYFMIIIKMGIVEEFHWTETDKWFSIFKYCLSAKKCEKKHFRSLSQKYILWVWRWDNAMV